MKAGNQIYKHSKDLRSSSSFWAYCHVDYFEVCIVTEEHDVCHISTEAIFFYVTDSSKLVLRT